MRPVSRIAILSPIMLLIMSPGCGQWSAHPLPNSLRIYVVGEGVEANIDAGTTHSNRAQGIAMRNGIVCAVDKFLNEQHLIGKVTFEFIDDGGTTEGAIRAAKRIRQDQTALAVIGHATSGTTRAAAAYYASAGLPLIMPIATATSVMYPNGDVNQNRFANCIRLPPADVPFQVAAITDIARSLTDGPVAIIADEVDDAAEYSRPLALALKRTLKNPTLDRLSAHERIADTLDTVLSFQPALIVFCGYSARAIPLLNSLASKTIRLTPPKMAPHIILSDGSFSSDLNTFGLTAHVTFPSPDIRSKEVDGSNPDPLRGALMKTKGLWSYEVFGYDSVLMLAIAVSHCRKHELPISRDNLRSVLRKGLAIYRGHTFVYSFDANGENIHPTYYCYECHSNSGSMNVSLKKIIGVKELTALPIPGEP